jgi:DEAD/DEAH box helicase domain-containing protein
MTLRRNDTYFSSLTHELNERAARATLGLLSPSSDALRHHLGELFERPPGSSTGFLADPVFEATFGWQAAERNMEQLAADGVLHEELVAAMDAAEGEARFARTRLPFTHQVQAWQVLKEQPPRSVVVSSGTGSGKTECFLVPILDDLTRQSLAGPLTGVRALFLYPLNALINSQRDRLRAWTNALGRRVRFCLYNGNTPGSLPAEMERLFPQEVGARDTLRSDPPPILVTNATMLEYMLVRQEDRPILDLSRGVLRWIVLDEAHTYVGSQAAEIALLLRRVLHAFGVQSKDVRFIATSATIGKAGDAGSIEQLRGYLSSVAGVSPEQVTVIEGHRQVPPLPPADESASLPILESLAAMSPRLRHDSLARVPRFRQLRDRLAGQAATLAELGQVVFTDTSDESRARTLRLLDLARHAELDGAPLLPLRGHIFHRSQRGLWACCSRSCSGRAALGLDDPSWPFGKTFVEHRDHCDADACEGLVFEVVLCSRCGAEYLSAQRSVVDQRNCYVPAPVLRGGDAEESLDEELDDEQEQTKSVLVGHRRLLGRYEARETDDHAATQLVRFERETGHFSEAGDVSLVEVGIRAKRANLYCANCGEGEKNAGDLLRAVQTGGAFHLGVAIPTLLEFSPPAESANRPFAGRRTITFSDSRQGTARFALRTQIDAERNYVRSYIYHLVEDRRPPPGQRQQDEAKLAELEPMLPGLPPGVRVIVEQQLVEIRQRLMGAAGGSVSWADAIARFSSSPAFTSWLVPQWRDRIDSPVRQAHFMLLREFARRPKRQNSLETLGLVRVNYRALAQGLLLPPDARRVQLTVDEWRDFLKLLLDFVVRAQSAVIFDPPDATRWMGTAMAPKFLRGPEAEPDDDNKIRLWPYVRHGRRHRFVELLAAALNLDLSAEDDLRAVQGLLAAAWTQLHDLRLLQRDESGSRMNLEDSVELTTVDRAWFCPVTRRILDTTFRGYSPFPLGQVFRKAEPLTMPRLPFPFPQNGDRLSAALPEGAIEDWLATDTAVRAARDRGVWSDFCDRIAAFASYYRVGEHSAQQSAGRLEELEREFKAARVNLLSCSTTMEMGVDIGGLSTVAMNNAPPSPANFLQRAGRAGRRGETAAVSLTMCKSQPHGEAIFRDPLWPFTTPIHVPSVSLQSERIVQRHVNALLLTHFLLTRANDALRLTMTSFFESPGSTVSSHAELFRLWLHEPPSAAVGAGIQQLTEGSCLGGLALSQLQLRTEGALDAVTDPWLRELKALKDSLDEVGGPPATNQSTPSAAQLAISRQLARLRGEYLLSELSTRGFLPGHGFPIGLVPFIHTNIEQLRRERAAREDRRRRRAEGNLQAHEREDSPFRRGGFPTRSLPTAIREYAPGSTVVIDGLVHHSEGVTLNWHLPPGDQPPSEIQAFRHAWRCKSCGAAGTSAAEVAACEVCGNEDLRPIRYLQPAGFAVQISERPTNILEGSTYIPARDPWISAGRGVWYDLPRPELGRVRVSERGQLFYRSGGLHGEGYALCLHCGYAVSMPARPSGAPYARPNVLDGHRHLRGGRSPKGDARCPGNDNPHASRFGQFLGAAIETDVLELQLHDTTLQAPLNDETVTTTIAAALRRALSEELGIDDREIGWAQIPSRGRHDDQRGRSIVLFDTAEGGAGYVSEAPRMLPKLLRAAREILACPRACDRACHACLLTFDTQHKLDRLDRNKALQALSQDILAALDLPPELHVFGDGENRYELEPLPVALAREFQRTGATDIQIFLDGDAEEWELEAWPLRDLVVRWSLAGTKVALCVDPTTFEALHATERSLLAALADLTNITVHVTPPPVLAREARLIAVTSNVRQQTRWAAIGGIANPPGADWASSMRLVASNSPTVTNAIAAPPLRSSRIRRPLAHTMREIVVHAQFDGCPITEFGARFWRIVGASAPDFATRLAHGRTIAAIEYCDRYFRSALVVRLFLELFKGLKAAGAAVSATKVQIVTLRCDPRRTGRDLITDDWAMDAARKAVLERMFDGHAAIAVVHKESRSIEHARQLKITWSDGQHMLVRLDEGLGFLESSARFDISRRPEDQARTLATLAFNLTRLRPQLATYLYVQDV